MPCYYETHGLQPPSRTNTSFHCPKPGCRRRLQPKTARSGANIGRDYIKCYNERHEDLIPAFWYFFPANAMPLPAAPPAAPTAPSTSSTAPPAPQAKTCAFGPCQLIKIHRLCPNQLCKRHCLEAGACAVHASPAPPPPPRKTLPALSGPSLEALSAVTQYAARIPQHVERTAREEHERHRERAAELMLIPSPSPSPRHDQISPINNEFVLVHWSDNLHAPAVTAIQNPPSWPQWIFKSKGPYQAYSTPYSSWMTVEANYIHTLSTNQPLLVRSLGVGAGVDEEDHIARAHAHADPPFPRFLPQPLLPKSKGKRRARQQITPLPDSDDEVIIVEKPCHLLTPASSILG
ncbi:hypothetical protein B0H14DRAFT_2592065 [Mycena olivaceomarginata]|nr:hypothetical protein B0H14DRAFT_2592065 [Mycena olivaceomarginata]